MMYKGLRSLTYKVADVEKAKKWYGKVFDTKPIFDTSFAAIFQVGDSALVLVHATDLKSKSDDSIVAYWEVDDVDVEFERLLNFGATVHSGINTVLNIKRATIIDPFGNIMGIKTTQEKTDAPSVEQQPSQTAMAVATARATAAVDEREEIRGHDYLAEIFLPEDIRACLKDKSLVKEMRANHMPGMYEYIVARTFYFDNIVQQALQNNTSQIVFLGAGYDTRAYRFKDLIDNKTKIFELDIHTTQEQKIKLLNQNNISTPKQLTFVPINFNTETLDDVLAGYGYKNDQTNLFIWEGVSYYLSSKEVDDILLFIRKTSSKNSTVCFDYATFWPEMMDAYGVKELTETMKSDYSGETTKFGIEKGKIESFLAERGYKIIDHITSEEMERKYLTLHNGSIAGKVTGLFCFAHASISS